MYARPTFPLSIVILNGGSADVRRGYCTACGTSLTYAHNRRAEEVDIALSTLDDPAQLAPRAHIWVEDKLPWIVIGDGLPQHRTTSGGAA